MNEFKDLLNQTEMTAYAYAKITGQAERTVYSWYQGKYGAPKAVIWGIREHIEKENIKKNMLDIKRI